MRLGLIGWYGHENAGDERILYCLRRLFAGKDLLVTQGFDDALRRLPDLDRCDFVVLGGGGLILRGCNRYARIFESVKTRFGCLGLGVETRHPDNEALIRVLLDRAEFILVRDRASAGRLGPHPRVTVGPDLTFLYPYDVADWTSEEACGLNLRSWPFWRAEHRGGWDKLMRRLSRSVPRLDRVYPLPKWDAARAAAAVGARFRRVVALPLDCGGHDGSDVQLLRRLLGPVEDEFRPGSLARCRYLVGMRLHSLVFACQMGIPFVSLSYQPKNAAFCADIGMEEASVDLYDPAQVEEALAWLKRDASRIREHLLRIREQSVGAIWRVVAPLVEMIEGAPARRRLPRSA